MYWTKLCVVDMSNSEVTNDVTIVDMVSKKTSHWKSEGVLLDLRLKIQLGTNGIFMELVYLTLPSP